MCTARTVLLYSNCILSIKKACFPWLLWCWNGSRGAIRIHSAVCFSPPLFCANSRIPIYILAVELNYCKHLCGPARHNRLAGSCIMSVPPTGSLRKYTVVYSRHVWHQGLVETQWNGLLDSLLGCWNIFQMNPSWLGFLCRCTSMCTHQEWIQFTITSKAVTFHTFLGELPKSSRLHRQHCEDYIHLQASSGFFFFFLQSQSAFIVFLQLSKDHTDRARHESKQRVWHL